MSKTAEIIERYKGTKTALDILKAILKFLDVPTMQKNPVDFHKTVRILRQDSRFRGLLAEFDFDESGINPYSELLDSLMYRLEISGVLGTINPRNTKYAIRIEFLQGVEDKFGSDELKSIKELSSEFKRLMSETWKSEV